MQLYYWQDKRGNFGDDLNPWLWPRIIPELIDNDPSTLLVGIGTLLNDRVPAQPKKLVFGSGVGYGPLPSIDDSWRFYCVRGPLSAKRLGLSEETAITDSASLIRDIVPPADGGRFPVSFVPHVASLEFGDWDSVCEELGIHLIDVRRGVDQVLSEIRGSELVIAEAMHAAVIADTLRVPWIPVRCYSSIYPFKWEDWCASLRLPYQPHRLSSLWADSTGVAALRSRLKRRLIELQLRRVIRTASPVLSRTAVLDDAMSRLRDALVALRQEQPSPAYS